MFPREQVCEFPQVQKTPLSILGANKKSMASAAKKGQTKSSSGDDDLKFVEETKSPKRDNRYIKAKQLTKRDKQFILSFVQTMEVSGKTKPFSHSWWVKTAKALAEHDFKATAVVKSEFAKDEPSFLQVGRKLSKDVLEKYCNSVVKDGQERATGMRTRSGYGSLGFDEELEDAKVAYCQWAEEVRGEEDRKTKRRRIGEEARRLGCQGRITRINKSGDGLEDLASAGTFNSPQAPMTARLDAYLAEEQKERKEILVVLKDLAGVLSGLVQKVQPGRA